MKKTSVKNILKRQDPAFEPLYWSRLPGKFVDKFSGEQMMKLPISDPLQWNRTLVEVVKDATTLIHKKSLSFQLIS